MITHDATTNTWSFTHGARSYTGYATREAAQEALYDVEHGRAVPVAPAFLSLDAQVARIGPWAPEYGQPDITIGTLPTGETIERGIGDGVPNDWITIARGDAELDIRAGGEIAGVTIGGRYLDDVTVEELDNLRALLVLDRAQLGAIADLGTDITQAIEVWYSLPNAEWKRIMRTVGFATWLRDPNRPREPLPEKKKTEEKTEAPATEPTREEVIATVNPLNYRIGYVLGGLSCAIDRLDSDRANRLLALLDQVGNARGDALLAAVDRLPDAQAELLTA